jgi:hypothetical protein
MISQHRFHQHPRTDMTPPVELHKLHSTALNMDNFEKAKEQQLSTIKRK